MTSPGYIAVPADVLKAIAEHLGENAQAEALMGEDRRLTPAELAVLEDAARWWVRMRDIAERQARAIAARLATESARPVSPASAR